MTFCAVVGSGLARGFEAFPGTTTFGAEEIDVIGLTVLPGPGTFNAGFEVTIFDPVGTMILCLPFEGGAIVLTGKEAF